MKIKKEAAHGTMDGRIARKGEITSDRAERELIWQEDGGKLYITCPGCSAINDISDHSISKNGAIAPCIVCVNCRTHYFTRLESWAGWFTAYCNTCDQNKKVKNMDGWKTLPSGCECCKSNTCPECIAKKNRKAKLGS